MEEWRFRPTHLLRRPLPLYSRGKIFQYPLDRILVGPWNRSGDFGREKSLHSSYKIKEGSHSFRYDLSSCVDFLFKNFRLTYSVSPSFTNLGRK